MIKKRVISKIQGIVGKDNVCSSLEERVCNSFDATDQKYHPDLVIFPNTPQQVAEILKLANKEQFPVVPRGAGSGFTGGSLPIKGGVVLVTAAMNRILEIDPENFIQTGAVAYSSVYINVSIDKMLETLSKLIRKYDVDGLVMHSNRSCKPYSLGEYDLQKMVMKELNIPTLIIEADMVDERSFSESQIETRIDAFMETLKG